MNKTKSEALLARRRKVVANGVGVLIQLLLVKRMVLLLLMLMAMN